MTQPIVLDEIINYSRNPKDDHYLSITRYAFLDSIKDFLTPPNIQKYLIDFCQHKKPCCGRTIYHYLTRIITKPEYLQYARHIINGQTIDILEIYKNALGSDRRRNNDVFGRTECIYVKGPDGWFLINSCKIIFCYMIHKMQLFQHIQNYLPEIEKLIKIEDQKKQLTHPSQAIQAIQTVHLLQTIDDEENEEETETPQISQPKQPKQFNMSQSMDWLPNFNTHNHDFKTTPGFFYL